MGLKKGAERVTGNSQPDSQNAIIWPSEFHIFFAQPSIGVGCFTKKGAKKMVYGLLAISIGDGLRIPRLKCCMLYML